MYAPIQLSNGTTMTLDIEIYAAEAMLSLLSCYVAGNVSTNLVLNRSLVVIECQHNRTEQNRAY